MSSAFPFKEPARDLQDDLTVTPDDHRLILREWNSAKQHPSFAPLILFRFFEAHPEYQEMFAHFAQVPQRALPESAAFLAQAGVMLTTFDVMIDSLVSQERLMQELERIGANHYQRGVSSDMIGEFLHILTYVMEQELGHSNHPRSKAAWQKGMRFFMTNVKTLYAKHKPAFSLYDY